MVSHLNVYLYDFSATCSFGKHVNFSCVEDSVIDYVIDCYVRPDSAFTRVKMSPITTRFEPRGLVSLYRFKSTFLKKFSSGSP